MKAETLIAKLSGVPEECEILVDSDWGEAEPHPLLTSGGNVLITPFRPRGLVEL